MCQGCRTLGELLSISESKIYGYDRAGSLSQASAAEVNFHKKSLVSLDLVKDALFDRRLLGV